MNKLDALWQYQQAELEADKLENKLKSTPARQKLNKLFNFLKEQQNKRLKLILKVKQQDKMLI